MKQLTFTGSTGAKLAAKLDEPTESTKSYALFAHCFTCGKDLAPINRMVRALNQEGIAVFRFDFTGIGESEGDFSETNFTTNVKDLLCAAAYMKEHYEAPSILFGHSLGGTAALVAASELPETKAVATVGAPNNTVNVLKQFTCDLDEIKYKGHANVSLGGRNFTIRQQFVENARRQNITAVIKELDLPLLIMHSPIDETVSIEHAREIYEAALHPKSFLSLDQADHLLLKDPSDSNYIAKVLAAWAIQYI